MATRDPDFVVRTRRRFLGGALIAGTAAVIQACSRTTTVAPTSAPAAAGSSSAQTPVSQRSSSAAETQSLDFTTFYTGPDGANMQQIVNKFDSDHPNIHVKFSSPAWGGDYVTKLQTAAIAGNPPDLVALHNYEIPGLSRFIYDISADVKAVGINPSDFLKAAWDLAFYQGKQYGVTMSTGTMALIYNKALFEKASLDPEKPPKTKDDFIAAGRAITKASDQQWGFVRDANWMPWLTFLWQDGGQLLTEDQKKAAFNDAAGKEALQLSANFVQADKISPPTAINPTDFYKGKIGMVFFGPWELAKLIDTNDKAGTKFGWSTYPKFFAKKSAVESTSHIYCLMKPKPENQAKKEASLTFLKWVVTQGSSQWTSSQIPSYNQVRDGMKDSKNPVTKQMGPWIEQAPMSIVPPAIIQWNQFFTTIKEGVESAIYKNTPPNQALATAADKVNGILAG